MCLELKSTSSHNSDWKHSFFCQNISQNKSSMAVIPPSLHQLDNTGQIPQRTSPNQALLRPLIYRFPQGLVLHRPPSWIEGATLSRLPLDQRLITRWRNVSERSSERWPCSLYFSFFICLNHEHLYRQNGMYWCKDISHYSSFAVFHYLVVYFFRRWERVRRCSSISTTECGAPCKMAAAL